MSPAKTGEAVFAPTNTASMKNHPVKDRIPPVNATTSMPARKTAELKPSKPVAASPVENEADMWRVAAVKARDAVSKLVFDASQLDKVERDDAVGMAKRLMVLVVADLGETDPDVEKDVFSEAFFNAKALLHGALNLSSDRLGPGVQAALHQALIIIDKLCDYVIGASKIDAVFDAIRTPPIDARAKPHQAAKQPSKFDLTISSNDWHELTFTKESMFHLYARATAERLAALANFAMKSFDGEFYMAGQLAQINEFAYQLEQVVGHLTTEAK